MVSVNNTPESQEDVSSSDELVDVYWQAVLDYEFERKQKLHDELKDHGKKLVG